MLLRKPIVTVGIAIGFGAFNAGVAACSSGRVAVSPGQDAASTTSTAAPQWVPTCADGGLTIAFNSMYSAYDGTHTFQIPAVVHGSDGQVTWTADTSMVKLEASSERPNEVLITMRQAGAAIIGAESTDGKCGSAPLQIAAAQESDWEIGHARYNDGTSLHLAAGATGGTGSPLEQGNGGPQCTNCHGVTATQGPFTNVSHTPEQTGGFSDAELLDIIKRGIWPKNDVFDNTIVPYPAWQNFHRWADITPDQEKGIVVYLRSLPPAPQSGSVNFGAFDTDAGSASSGGTDDANTGAGD